MDILSFKAVHIIAFVAWFAGLFYIVRLFVYHTEALEDGGEGKDILTKQYHLMEKKLYRIIMSPAMGITVLAGSAMLIINPAYLKEGWMHIKLTLVLVLIIYQSICKKVMKKLDKGEMPMKSIQFRLFNEVPTIILVAIVLLAVFRTQMSMTNLMLVIVVLVILIVGATLLAKKARDKKK